MQGEDHNGKVGVSLGGGGGILILPSYNPNLGSFALNHCACEPFACEKLNMIGGQNHRSATWCRGVGHWCDGLWAREGDGLRLLQGLHLFPDELAESLLLHQAGVTAFGATDSVSTVDASSTWSVSGLEAALCESL